MHYHRILVDPVPLIEGMVIDKRDFDYRKWSIRDAEILEKAAKKIREGYASTVCTCKPPLHSGGTHCARCGKKITEVKNAQKIKFRA